MIGLDKVTDSTFSSEYRTEFIFISRTEKSDTKIVDQLAILHSDTLRDLAPLP